MAAIDWRSRLNERTFCKLLRENNVTDSKRSSNNECKCLIAINQNDLFVWDNANSCLAFFNLLNLTQSERRNRYQILKCTNSPSFIVDWLTWSNSKSHLALWGQVGVTILRLPTKYGKYAEFEGGKDIISCKSIQVGSYFFSSNQNVKLLQLSWHPASTADNHVVILTSDNQLSIYDILEPETAIQVISLYSGETEPSYPMSLTQITIQSALGDYVTSFDFSPTPIDICKKTSSLKAGHKDSHTIWPIYCVRGNGDVVVAFSDISPRPIKLPIQGPLMMRPDNEDNYGTDACSIICIQSTPTVVVIATCDGRLHHGILLLKDSDETLLQSESSYGSSRDSSMYHQPEEMFIHVIETVELELTLTMPPIQGDHVAVEDMYTCPIKLIRDDTSSHRYHCLHSAGVHSLVLPWLPKLERFLAGDDEEEVLPSHNVSIVEHLICTKPELNSPNCPVYGLSQFKDDTVGTILLALSRDYEFESVRMSDMRYLTNDTQLLSSNSGRMLPSPLRKISREPFDVRIRRILQKNVSSPLIRTGTNTDMSQQECFQLLSRATQIFREEYIQKQDLARQELQRRVGILKEQKSLQVEDLNQLQSSRNILSDKAEQLAVSLDDCTVKQKQLLRRLENIMRKLQSRVPFLSKAERSMKQELETIHERLAVLKRSLEQVQVRKDYQQSQIKQSMRINQPSPVLKKNQMSQLRQVIKQEGDEIADLMKNLNALKMDSNLTLK
ncbi:ribosomal small subunit export from nucleus [Mactra antiquata]